MNGALLLDATLITGGLLIVSVAKAIVRKRAAYRYTMNLSRLLTAFLTGALALLLYHFYALDFNVNYVFSKVGSETPLLYRLSAVWIGQEGVFLVWAWALSLCTLVYAEKSRLKEIADRKIHLILVILIVFFTSLAHLMDPFQPTMTAVASEAASSGVGLDVALGTMQANGLYIPAEGFIEGQGMNPFLMSPWMALHPPILFIAYALAAVPFAVCLLHLYGQKIKWDAKTRPWARLSWVLLSAGLIIGSYWAYEELSYGGYWTWDPIETASLIPWITLTIFLHGSHEYRRQKNFSIISPVMGVLTTVLIVYGTFITKSGLVQSSHAYSKSVITPLLASAILLSIAVLMFAAGRMYLSQKKKSIKWRPIISVSNAFYLSTILFIILLGVLTWGITYPLFVKLTSDKAVSVGKVFYNLRGYPLMTLQLFLSGFCLLLWVLKKDSLLALSAGVLMVSLAGYVFRPTGSVFVDVFVPIFVFVTLSIILRLRKDIATMSDKRRILRSASGHLLHLGIAILILGVVASSTLQSGNDVVYSYPQEINTVKEAGAGYSVKVIGLNVYQDTGANWVQELNVTIQKEGVSLGDLTLRVVNDRKYGKLPKVAILRGLSSDVYAVYYGISGMHSDGSASLPINIKIIPYTTLVWAGSILAALSGLMIYLIDLILLKE